MCIRDRMYDLFAWKLRSNVEQLNGGCIGGIGIRCWLVRIGCSLSRSLRLLSVVSNRVSLVFKIRIVDCVVVNCCCSSALVFISKSSI